MIQGVRERIASHCTASLVFMPLKCLYFRVPKMISDKIPDFSLAVEKKVLVDFL